MAEALDIVGRHRTYVSFDIDAVDPSYAPGTGTPEIGGLTTREAQALIRELDGLDIVGADLAEVAPPLDPSGLTAMTGATLAFELLRHRGRNFRETTPRALCEGLRKLADRGVERAEVLRVGVDKAGLPKW